jgi:molecular chaperone GrpE
MSQNEHTAKNEDITNASEPQENNEHLEYESFSEEIEPAPIHDVHSEQNAADQNADAIRINTLESELERTKDQMIRALAEAENTRRRATKDREDASKFAVTSFSRDLLSVADNLRRALYAIPAELIAENPQVKSFTDGIEATERELLRSFEKNGIQKIEPLDQPFDPNFHEVMFEAPMPDKPNGTIIQVLEPGYTISGRILRPARVGISKGGVDSTSTPPTEPGQNVNTEA